ncbi:LysR substrate-binding domain-containing protein [Roseovarius sp. 2305UL8-3]|uniref:LysR substrate-binding domain-containing protein n=1 Tax=Roseovarius conchicola TaxID=3121636 RepID=UPI003526E74B
MIATNIPTDLLRTFITVIDLGGYTRAAEALGRSQPAISLQMNRLQELLQIKLLEQDGRARKLTESGNALAAYARQILHLNDEAVARFQGLDKQGILRIGLPTDFAVSKLQTEVAQFIDDYPNVDVKVVCGLSRALFESLHRGELDLIIGLSSAASQQYLVRVWEDQPIWATSKKRLPKDGSPVPLVCHPKGCEYRMRMTEALGMINRDWRVVYTSPDISGLLHAVSEGLGVSALTHATLTPDLRILSEDMGFPKLQKIRIGLFYKLPEMSAAGIELSNRLIQCLDENADKYFTHSEHPPKP